MSNSNENIDFSKYEYKRPTNLDARPKLEDIVEYDDHDYNNPYGDQNYDIPIIQGLSPNAKKQPKLDKGTAYTSFARRKEKPETSFRNPRTQDEYMNQIMDLVGSKQNRDIIRNNDLISTAGASIWIDKHHRDKGWYVESKDYDGDGIPEVMVKRPDDSLYAVNGYYVKKSDMGTRQPYFEQFPTREDRKLAREEGIRMSNFASLKYGPKKFDPKKPFDIEYEKDPYSDPLYLKQLLTHRAPRIPTTRSPYQVFTMLISKTIWENFKVWLGTESAYSFTENKGSEKNPKYEFSNLKDERKYLAIEDMLSASAYLYEKYVKQPVLELFKSDEILQKAWAKLQLKLTNARARFEANPTEENKKKLEKIHKLLSDEGLATLELLKVITESKAFKEACENRVLEIIDDKNRRDFCNMAYKEIIFAQTNNSNLVATALNNNTEVDMRQIMKLRTESQEMKSKTKHKSYREHRKYLA